MRDAGVGVGGLGVGGVAGAARRRGVRSRVAVVLGVVVAILGATPAPAPASVEGSLLEARGLDRVCPVQDSVADADEPGGDADEPGGDADEPGGDADEPGGDADEPRFPDIGTTHAPAIRCAVDYRLVSGFADGTFRPDLAITRQQMATFVAAWLRTALGVELEVPDEPVFTDVQGGVHAEAIDALALAGIVSGRPDGTFGPTETLTRGQFTRAVAGAISFADVLQADGPLPPEGAGVGFLDVGGTTFESTILSLAGIGVALGTGEGVFEPDLYVTRGQLSTFLMRAADYLDEYQRWRPTALGPVTLRAELYLLTDAAEEGDDADGGDDPDDGTSELTPTLVGEVELSLDAFGATVEYALTVAPTLGPYEPSSGLTLHLGDPGDDPAAVLELVTAEELDRAGPGEMTGTVFESASAVRFSRLLGELGEVYVQLASAGRPDGVARGELVVVTGN